MFFGPTEAELAKAEERDWENMSGEDLEHMISLATGEIARLSRLIIRDGRGSADGFNGRRFILLQDKAVRLCEHNLHSAQDIIARYSALLKSAKMPAVKMSVSEFDKTVLHVLKSVSKGIATRFFTRREHYSHPSAGRTSSVSAAGSISSRSCIGAGC